jgi:hypothetical protein
MNIRHALAHTITTLSASRIRFLWYRYVGAPDRLASLRWVWTPWTYRFGHGGWVFLSFGWLRSYRHGRSRLGQQPRARTNSPWRNLR